MKNISEVRSDPKGRNITESKRMYWKENISMKKRQHYEKLDISKHTGALFWKELNITKEYREKTKTRKWIWRGNWDLTLINSIWYSPSWKWNTSTFKTASNNKNYSLTTWYWDQLDACVVPIIGQILFLVGNIIYIFSFLSWIEQKTSFPLFIYSVNYIISDWWYDIV